MRHLSTPDAWKSPKDGTVENGAVENGTVENGTGNPPLAPSILSLLFKRPAVYARPVMKRR